MERQSRRKLAGGLGLVTAAMFATAVIASVPGLSYASTASTSSSSETSTLLAPNRCHLRTEANPNSVWVPPNFESCYDCLNRAAYLHSQTGIDYYCTYNPSNGKTDLHYDL
ncbi:hypothetical protein [Nonomuraea sp. NPDC049695]|uniref:hypothetical protein n=1 Tax=Nonomuraea sp. NPDC049695 TaxID=3154734 RepID=UPI0034291C68